MVECPLALTHWLEKSKVNYVDIPNYLLNLHEVYEEHSRQAICLSNVSLDCSLNQPFVACKDPTVSLATL